MIDSVASGSSNENYERQLSSYLSPEHMDAYKLLSDEKVMEDILSYTSNEKAYALGQSSDLDRSQLTSAIRKHTGWDAKTADQIMQDLLDLNVLATEDMTKASYSDNVNRDALLANAMYKHTLEPLLHSAQQEAEDYLGQLRGSVPNYVSVGVEIKERTDMNYGLEAGYDPINQRVRIKECQPSIIGETPSEKIIFGNSSIDRDVIYNAFMVHEYSHAINADKHSINTKEKELIDEGFAVYSLLSYCEEKASRGDGRYAQFAKEYLDQCMQADSKYAEGLRIVSGIMNKPSSEQNSNPYNVVEQYLSKGTDLEKLSADYGEAGEKAIYGRLERLKEYI